jgi:hypothetical protein
VDWAFTFAYINNNVNVNVNDERAWMRMRMRNGRSELPFASAQSLIFFGIMEWIDWCDGTSVVSILESALKVLKTKERERENVEDR